MKEVIYQAILDCGKNVETNVEMNNIWMNLLLFCLLICIPISLGYLIVKQRKIWLIVFLISLTGSYGLGNAIEVNKDEKENEIFTRTLAKKKTDTIVVSKIEFILQQETKNHYPFKQPKHTTTKSYYTYYIRTNTNDNIIVENNLARLLPELLTTKDDDKVVYDYLIICGKKYIVSWHVLGISITVLERRHLISDAFCYTKKTHQLISLLLSSIFYKLGTGNFILISMTGFQKYYIIGDI